MLIKKTLFLITAPILLFTVSLFASADAPSSSEVSSDWIEIPEATPGSHNPQHNPQGARRKTADYQATREQLSERYPYALMSYLSEMDSILTSEEQDKQLFIIFRLAYLGSRGIQLIADPEAIPEQWQRHFIDTREKTVKAGQKSHQVIGQISIPGSTIKVRAFKQTADPFADDPDQENKIILALSGEKPNGALQCLVTETRPLHPDRSACSLAIKQLQNITEFAESFKALYPYHSLEITGYSYSGAVAQVVMLTSESVDRAYIFNSFGIHPSWVKGQSEDKLANIHHSYIEGSFLYGQGSYNPVSRYSQWRLPKHKVVVPGMKVSAREHMSQIRQIYRLKHQDNWLNTFYNFVTSGWVLHSKESVLRAFEANLNLNFPW